MRRQDPFYDPNDTDQLLRKADAALHNDIDPDWEDEFEDFEDTMVYQNFSNGYGQNVRNYNNHYGMDRPAPPRQQSQPKPQSQPQPKPRQNIQQNQPPIRAYNADIAADNKKPRRNTMADAAVRQAQAKAAAKQPHSKADTQKPYHKAHVRPAQPEMEEPAKPASPRRRRSGCLMPILVVIALLIFSWFFLVRPPKSEQSIGSRKFDTASILLCGTDADGTRTDTMMLLYISGSERRVNLVSLPRDTYTITSSGKGAKLNSAYGRNGTGEEGMEGLFDYVQDIIGYRPDGYVLVDFNIIMDIVDAMGGVEVDVPMAMSWETPEINFKFSVEEGLQTLNGNDVLGVLRYRHGYYNQDLGRVEMQRKVLKACMEQWLKPKNVPKLFKLLKLFKARSLSNLSLSNYLWAGLRVATIGTKKLATETLPGYPTMIGDQSCYVLYPDEVAELINEVANPYKVEISSSDLNIAG